MNNLEEQRLSNQLLLFQFSGALQLLCERLRRRFPQSLTENQKVSGRVAGRTFLARANASILMACVRRRLAMREF